jgi:magnesium transporter
MIAHHAPPPLVAHVRDDSAALQQAVAHVAVNVPRSAPGDRVADVRAELARRRFECVEDVAVLDGERLVGLLPIERLLPAPADTPVVQMMDAQPPVVAPGSDQEAVAWEMVRRGESSVAVVDDDGRFIGLIPPHRMIGVLLAEHDEDIARMGGYLSRASSARLAAEEPLVRRLWHRLPWLVIGLLGAMLSAVVVAAFRDDLEANVLLAVFIPAVVYMAAAVGTQTEALLIRGLSAGVEVRTVARREAATGAILGLLLASVFLPFVWLAWGEGRVALAVAIALFAACAIATLVAMLLPWLLYRWGRDPAFGSGPLATVVQDLLSILTYFAVASLLVT